MNNSQPTTAQQNEIERISKIIDCPVKIVRHCMLLIGPSIPAIDAYWQMNKDRLMCQIEGEFLEHEPVLSLL